MKKIKLVVLILTFVVICGCDGVRTSIDSGSELNRSSAYIYGHFYNQSKGGNFNLSLRIENMNLNNLREKPILLQFSHAQELSVIEIAPGTYDINSLQIPGKYLFGGSRFPTSQVFRGLGPVKITLEPGKAYYLGDFTGKVSVNCSRTLCRYRWGLSKFSASYAISSAKFNAEYLNLKGLQKVNLFLDIAMQVKSAMSLKVRRNR
ncbi:hypothetical protein MNBD_GAMMA12-2920 [hydrothermal vent metagenome]|uniref:Uncharacterized protein n=1 Tax=hydrothermal vent metagenome TaxID=652676 RepID=A0A3B0YQN2_9ZZZZ